MTHARLEPFVACITGTSESSGRLAGWPDTLVARLKRELPLQPEAVGPIVLWDKGHGGWTSQDILNEAPDIAALRPNFILAESGDMNDSFVSGGVPTIARPQKITNMRAAAAIWTAAIPGVDIVWRTANPVSTAVGVGRPNLSDYFTDTLATATTDGFGHLDNAAAWPSPLPEWMTFSFDGLHPVWANAVELYEYRAILLLFRQKLATWWGLAAPVAPAYPAAPDVHYLAIAGGGGGGSGAAGGGGGAGGVLRGMDYLAALLGAFSIGAAGAVDGNGGGTTIGAYKAIGGGAGGTYTADLTASRGKDGGSSGGGGTFAALHAAGIARLGQGNYGGACNAGNNAGAGGGGGCGTPGTAGAALDGGAGGTGWQDDVPGDSQAVCGGGPGGTVGGAQPAYGLGAGPTHFGGGGKGGGPAAADAGGIGTGYIWYPGAPRAAGGVITSSGGFTVHKLAGAGTLV